MTGTLLKKNQVNSASICEDWWVRIETATMFKQFWNYIKALLSCNESYFVNLDILLEQAQREMTEVHMCNRERAVQAITQKNNLQKLVDNLQKKTEMLQAKAELAQKRGESDLASELLKEKKSYESSLTATQASLAHAVETTGHIKAAIKREEARIREKTAEALRMKAEWKNAQIQKMIDRMDDRWFTDPFTSLFKEKSEPKNPQEELEQAERELARHIWQDEILTQREERQLETALAAKRERILDARARRSIKIRQLRWDLDELSSRVNR